MEIFDLDGYSYSISDEQSNSTYHVLKLKRNNKKGGRINIVDKRVVRTQAPKRIKQAIMSGKFNSFRKLK